MAKQLTLKVPNGDQEITLTSDMFVNSWKHVECYHKELKPAESYISFSIPYNQTIVQNLLSHGDEDIKAIITDGDTICFTGFLRKNFTVSKTQNNQPISLEIRSPAYKLQTEIETDAHYVSQSVLQLINILLQTAGLYDIDKTASEIGTTTEIQNSLSELIDIAIFSEGDKVNELIQQICFEIGCVYNFDENGDFRLYPLFNEVSSLHTFSENNMYKEVQVVKTEQKADSINLKWSEKKYITDTVIFADTQSGDSSNSCNITVPAGEYLYGTETNKCEYDNDEGAVIWADSAVLTVKGISNTYQAENKGTYLSLSYINNTAREQKITKLEVKGDAWIKVNGENITKTINGTKTKDFNITFLNSQQKIQTLAENIAQYYKYQDFSIRVFSYDDISIGSFVTVTAEGIGTIVARVIQKNTYATRTYYEYNLEAAKEYETIVIETKKKKQASSDYNLQKQINDTNEQISGLYSNHVVTLYKNGNGSVITQTGITTDLTYSFANNTLAWKDSTKSNGWKFTLEEASGSGTVYITTATAFGKTATDDIAPNEWSEPIPRGENGNNGYNTRTIQLFQRSDAQPVDLPFDFVLDFTARNLSITTTQLNGWVTSFPAINEDNDPCWEIHVTALSNTTTDTITTAQWSTPEKVSQDVTVTKAEIQEMINESQQASAPVVYADTTFGGFAVDVDSKTPIAQSITTTIHVMQSERELEFQFGTITLPAGFFESYSGNTLTIYVAAGTTIKNGNINIPIIYRPYIATDTYGDEAGSYYIDEAEENYGYWVLGTEETTYNLGFGYTQIQGGRYLNKTLNLPFNSVSNIPSNTDAIIGDYFTWCGANNTTDSRVTTALLTGGVYAFDGYQWKKDTAPSHLQGALSDILSNAEADLEHNNSEVVGLFQKIVSQEVIAANLTVTGTAFMNKLQAAEIYADTFESYDEKAKGYAEDAEGNAVDQVYTDTGIGTLTNKTVIQGGHIKTDLIETSSITIGQSQVTGLINALDGKASTTYADNAAGTAESNAKTYADGAAGTAESNAKTYADGAAGTAESNAKSHADTKANDALDAALAAFVGVNNVRDHTIIEGGKITTGLIDTDAIKATEGFFNEIEVSGTVYATDGRFSAGIGAVTYPADSSIPYPNNAKITNYSLPETTFTWTVYYKKPCRLKIYRYEKSKSNQETRRLLADLQLLSETGTNGTVFGDIYNNIFGFKTITGGVQFSVYQSAETLIKEYKIIQVQEIIGDL